MNNTTKKFKQFGFGLVDLIISMGIGVVLVSGVTKVYVDTIEHTTGNVVNMRLDQDLQSIVQLISYELRRAGYDADAGAGGDTDFGIEEFTNKCIRYSYDRPNSADGLLTSDEISGFRFKDSEIQFGTGVSSCNKGKWSAINSTNTTKITSFSFKISEMCMNVKDGTNCNSLDDPKALTHPYVAPEVGDMMIKKYNVEFSLTGKSAIDESNEKTVTMVLRMLNEIKQTKS